MPPRKQTKRSPKINKTKVNAKLTTRTTRSSRANTKITKDTTSLTAEEVARTKEILRQFDLQTEYGPCVGILRTNRWKRANDLGFNPPEEVMKILEDQRYIDSIPDINQNLWFDELGC